MRPTACCALEILTASCSPLVKRDWRGGLPRDYVRDFASAFQDTVGEFGLPPTFPHKSGEYDFFHIRHGDLIFLCMGYKGTNPALIFNFLHRFIDLLKFYFEQLEEESIRDNFVLIYELLDEIMDYGYPQFTEGHVLERFITLDAHRLEGVQPPSTITNAISWRPEGLHYPKNEVFLDVVEQCSISVNSFGEVIHSSLHGTIKMKAQLSGMPECKLGLNEKFSPWRARNTSQVGQLQSTDDVNFHRCVKLDKFSADKSIVFVPPDGRFELLSYRISGSVPPLIWVSAKRVIIGNTRLKYEIKLSTSFKERYTAHEIKVRIPVDGDATKPETQCKIGEVVYAPESESINWYIKSLSGSKDVDLALIVSVPSVRPENMTSSRNHVEVHFEIPYFTPSGIQVRYLKVFEDSGYSALPWVRYLTRSGDYTFKIS